MRKLVVSGIVLLVVVFGAVAYLVMTTPKSAPLLHFPLTPEQEQFVSRAPATAEAFAFVPAAAVVQAKLLANPVTREPLLEWADRQPLPSSWILGGADLLVWRNGRATSFAVRFDRVRGVLVRIWTSIAGPHDATWDGPVMFIGDAAVAPHPIDLALANGLPDGDALVVQRDRSRGAFPPISRPAMSSVRVEPTEVTVVSRARTDERPVVIAPIRGSFPASAMIAATFASPPRLLGDLSRLLGADVMALVTSGGALALYDIDAGLLLPRPKGVIVIRSDERSRAAIEDYRKYIDLVGETRELRDTTVVSFDRSSANRYINDAMVQAAWPANQWAGRIRPATLLPVLQKLSESPGLRFAAPRIYRSARDLRNWIGPLARAESVEAAQSVAGDIEELRVRVASK